LYDNGLLLEGLHPNPAEMVGRIQALMEAASRR
jgi:molecular chaperone HtpG